MGGSCLEEDYPYTGLDEQECKKTCVPAVKVNATMPYTQPKWTLPPEKGYEEALVKGPIVVGIAAGSKLFQFYKNGVIRNCKDLSINHAVTLGYRGQHNNNPDEKNIESWGIVNSWGTDWGEDGVGYIEAGQQN
eukprot:UN03361